MTNGVTICSATQFPSVIAAECPDEVVSAAPPSEPPTGRTWHRVFIEDIYNVQLAEYKNALRKVLAIGQTRTVVINCQHGKSRSGALALAMVYQRDAEGVALFFDEHPEAEPNPLLLILADDMLNAQGDLWRRCRGRYKGSML